MKAGTMSAHDLTLSLLLVIQLVDMIHGAASSSTSRPPRITEHPSDVTVMRNDPATLRCAFTGNPPPEVTWYRDGEVLEPRGHRLLLPDGALFFLRVTQGRGRNGGDAGTYWCAARNSAGVARSRNATLTVAYLQPDFRLLPEPTRAVLGETATLHCQAPRGQPEPDVTWRRNGLPIAWDDELALDKERVKVTENGDLVVRHVLPSDEGKYQCVAHNMAGTRESPIVPLSVHVRPQVSIAVKEAVVVLGEDAVFECNASGDPTPSLLWRRLDAPLPAGRARATENRSGLKIERVTLADGGQYQCEVENAVGSASAVVHLTVLVPPSWNSSPPNDLHVEIRQNVSVDCTASGSPLPLIFWRREGLKQQDLNESRWNVLSNGSLIIRDTDKADSGPLYCAAINEGGAILARVNLDVSLPTYAVPVFFKIGPTNQTLPIRSPALLQCETDNSTVHWTRNGTAVDVDTADQRFRLLPSGSLQIENLQLDDSGVYTCWAGENQTLSSWTATLTVENPINPNVAFNRAPSDPMALPGPPTQPVMTNHTASSVTINWQSSSRMGASPLIGYTVEVFSPDGRLPSAWSWSQTNKTDSAGGWVVVARRLKANSLTVEGLKAGSSILAVVRAENSHGLSLPSPTSRWIQTATNWIVHPELIQTRDLLSGSLLQLNHVAPLNATAVELHWDIVDGESYIEGLYLFHFKNSAAADSHDAAAVKIRSTLITEPSLMAHTLASLSPDTNYTFFLIPFYGSVEGRPSNSKSVKTTEDAPSGYPQNVTVRQFNESSVLVQWTAPLPHQRNGNISAYQIYVYSAETNMLLANLTLPSTSTSIAVGGLEGGTRYAFRAAAWTRMGIGPASPPFVLAIEMTNPTSTVPISDQGGMNSLLPPGTMAQETWLIVLIGGTLLVFLLTVVLVVVIKRRKMRKNGGVGRQSSSDQGFLWPTPTQPWTSSDPSKDVHPQLGPDYAEVFHHSNPMSSFIAQPPAAYASTTLVRNSSASLPFRYQPGGRSVHQADPCSFSVQMRKSSQPLIPNWVELLPPPPQHPPPPLTPADQPKSQYPSFITSTLPSSMHVGAAGSGGCNPVSGGHHYPLRTSLNAQSHPTLISDHVRNSFQAHLNRHSGGPQLTPQQQQRYPGSSQVDDALYATCTYDQIEHYPLSSYR